MVSNRMRVGIVGGTGSEGRGLARKLAHAGADVTLGSRDSARASDTAARMAAEHPGTAIRGASNREAIQSAEIVILAIPFSHIEATIAAERAAFRPGTLVVDVTVPVVFEGGAPRFVELPDGSAGELVRRLLPESVSVGCAFKTIPASLLEQADPLSCDRLRMRRLEVDSRAHNGARRVDSHAAAG